MYKEWLYYTCKWATKGLDANDYEIWQHLIADLDKLCPDCQEGHICETCKNSGLKLTEIEKMILRGIELSLDENTVNSVN